MTGLQDRPPIAATNKRSSGKAALLSAHPGDGEKRTLNTFTCPNICRTSSYISPQGGSCRICNKKNATKLNDHDCLLLAVLWGSSSAPNENLIDSSTNHMKSKSTVASKDLWSNMDISCVRPCLYTLPLSISRYCNRCGRVVEVWVMYDAADDDDDDVHVVTAISSQ